MKNSTELRAHSSGIERVAWNPTKESELASCSSDGTVRFWDVRSKTCSGTVAVGGEAFTLAWAGDGSVVLVGRKDDTLVPVDVGSMRAGPPLPQTVQTNQTAFGHATPPREVLVTTGEGSVKVLGWPGMEGLHVLHAHTSACFSLELCPRGRYLGVGGSDALVTLWDTTEWVCRRSLSAMVGAVRSLSFSFDGSYVVGGSDEGNGLEIVSFLLLWVEGMRASEWWLTRCLGTGSCRDGRIRSYCPDDESGALRGVASVEILAGIFW